MSDITPAFKLFNLLISKDFEPDMLDSSGKPAPDPAEAEIFSFDFRAESGKDYGTVVIMLTTTGDLDVYCADNVGSTMEEADKTEWFDFLAQLKNFAVRNNRMNFSVKNLNHLRYSMQGQAAIKEGLFESWQGRRDVSWNAGANQSRLMIKHKRNLGEDEARFRCVDSLFIETAEGERYKLPFKNLTAGKAMLEHVRMGGRPYDMRGQHIVEMVTELALLSRFRRANQGQLLEGDTATLVEQTNAYYTTLQRSLKSLTSQRGYNTYFESWTPADVTEESVVIEGLKHLFVTQTIDQRIEDALPLIARIQQQENAMKEANIFETWANRLVEGTWQLPDTPEKQAKLIELLSQDLPVGADATNATEQLYNLIGDDELFDQLEALADRDANADARQVVYDRMQEMSSDPDVLKVINSLNIDADYEMNPPEATNPADLEPDEPVQEGELEDCNSIGGDAADELIRGVSTKQDNDMVEEESDYPEYQDDLASILKAAGVNDTVRAAPDYETDVAEGAEGSTAQIVKKLLDPLAQGLSGGGSKSLKNHLVAEQGIHESRLMDSAGETIDHILNRFKHEVKTFEQGGDLDDDLYQALFDYYNDQGEIPYGIAKARDGDPMEWVAQNLESHLSGGGIVGGNPDEDYGIERESVGDYAEEKSRMQALAGIQDEGVLGTVGGAMGGGFLGALGGGALGGTIGGPAGAMLGAKAGQGIGMAAGAVGGQELTKGGSGIIEQDDLQQELEEMLAEFNMDSEETDESVDTFNPARDTKSSYALQKGAETAPFMAVGALPGAVIGGGIGAMVGQPAIGAALGGAAGAYAGKKVADNSIYADDGKTPSNWKPTAEGWKGGLAGGVAGGVGGEMLGSKAGEIGGEMIGKTVGKTIGTAAAAGTGPFAGALGGLTGSAGEVMGGKIGQVVGKFAGGVAGGVAGGAAGSAIGDKLGGKEKETAEGKLGAVAGGALGAAATRSVKGTVAGARLGSAVQDRFAKKKEATAEDLDTDGVMMTRPSNMSSESAEPAGSALQGQYGHSGKMKSVASDTSYLDRLRELSGMMRSDKI